jgi:hypothetical protein
MQVDPQPVGDHFVQFLYCFSLGRSVHDGFRGEGKHEYLGAVLLGPVFRWSRADVHAFLVEHRRFLNDKYVLPALEEFKGCGVLGVLA